MARLLLTFLFAVAAFGQRNEFSIQFGGTVTQRREIALPALVQPILGETTLREDNGYAGGFVYRVRLVRFGQAALMAELPVMIVQATNADLLPLIARPFFGSTSGAAGFVTPGGVLRFFPDGRLSPFAFFGAGYARVIEAQLTSLEPIRGDFVDRGTWAINYGGGIDFGLARVLALRAELRNYYTGPAETLFSLPQETRQRNTLLLTGGLVFRF